MFITNCYTRMTEINKENDAATEMLPDEYHTVVSSTVCCDLTSQEQCSICYNDIDNVNVAVTRCGHRFHSSCIFEMMANGGRDCPLCRTKLARDVQADIDEPDYGVEEWGSDIEENEPEVTITNVEVMVANSDQTYEHSMSIETLAERLLTMGYTNVDILRLYIGNSLRTENPEKYTREFCSKLSSDIEDIVHLPERQTITFNCPTVTRYSMQELREYYRLMCIDSALQDDT